MENLAENKTKERISKVTSSFLLLLILISLGVSLYYNMTLQEQINKRDFLIEKLTQRDSILNKIMNIKYDSISKSISYSYRTRDGKILKYNELSVELDKSLEDYNKIAEKHKSIVDQNNQNINDYNSLSKSFNSLTQDHTKLIEKYNSLVGEYNELAERKTKLSNSFNQVTDSLSSFKTVIKLIQSNYPIDFKINQDGTIKEISIKAEQLDSALILLPYFRNRLKLDKDKKVWSIKTGQ